MLFILRRVFDDLCVQNEVIMIQKELNGSSFVSYFELKHDHF